MTAQRSSARSGSAPGCQLPQHVCRCSTHRMNEHRRIDVHHHLLPEDYVRWLKDQGVTAAGGRALPAWDVPSTLEMMDHQGIATGVLSVAAPGTHLGDGTGAAAWARRVNE